MNNKTTQNFNQKYFLFWMIYFYFYFYFYLPRRYKGLGEISRIQDRPEVERGEEAVEEGSEEKGTAEEEREEDDGHDILEVKREEEGRIDCVGSVETVVLDSTFESVSTISVFSISFMYPASDDSNL